VLLQATNMKLDEKRSSHSPAVSILTPAYNAAEYLDEAVRSALAQTVEDLELIVIDDGSTDDTPAVARRLAEQDGRVRVAATDHVGVSAARNIGMRLARGRVFALLDADDLWHTDFLRVQLSILDAIPDADVVSGNALSLGGPLDGRPLVTMSSRCHAVSLLDMIENEHAVCVMSVFRRRVFELPGGFNEELARGEDYDFWLRAALHGCGVIRNPEPLARYRRRADSLSAAELSMLDAMVDVLGRLRRTNQLTEPAATAIDRRVAVLVERRLWTSAKSNLLRGNYAAASGEFDHLSAMRRSAASRLVARVSRFAPVVLRVAYQTKLALRV